MRPFDKRGSGGRPPDMTMAWRATPERVKASNTAAFMRAHQISGLEELRQRAASDPEWFWEAVVDFLGLPFERRWRAVRDTSRGHPWATWFVGGTFNLSRACVDRWADEDPGRTALRSEKETGETRELSFGELRDVVGRLASVLTDLGVSRGDAVAVFLPMGEEAVVSLLAVARIGAIFVPVFSGYGAEAVATRLIDPKPKVMICANGFQRRGGLVEMKEVADQAIEKAGGLSRVLVVDYEARADTPMRDGQRRVVARPRCCGRAGPSRPHQHRGPRPHRLHLRDHRPTQGGGARTGGADCQDRRRGRFPR